MGRKRLSEEQKKVNTKIRIRADYKKKAVDLGLNFSQVMEDALLKIFKSNPKQ